jgi:hypothetical protein
MDSSDSGTDVTDVADACAQEVVLGNEDFYRERTEPEAPHSGSITYVPGGGGPGDRYLPYRLGTMPLYVPPMTVPVVEKYVGRSVAISGKVVDVGYGAELWAATIRRSPCP